MANAKYKKCPRCELNYIPVAEEMCDVCKSELGLDSKIVLLDDIIDDDEPLKLCPICKTAYIGMEEEMCENCLAHQAQLVSEDSEDDDSWRTYLDDDDTDDALDDATEIPLDELRDDEEYEDDEFEDEENVDIELDDYDDYIDDFGSDFDEDDEDEDELDDDED